MKNSHSIRYYEKRLAKLERVADSINYPIDWDLCDDLEEMVAECVGLGR